MHAVGLAKPGSPGFLGGEAQDRGEPDGQAPVQLVQHRPRRSAAQAGRRVAVDRVLAHVEIERREVGVTEVVDIRINAGPVVAVGCRADAGIQLRQAVEHPAFQLRQLLERQAFGFGEPVQAAQHPAQGVAQAAVEFRLLLQNFRSDAQIVAGVGRHDPQAQDVGAVFVGDLVRGGDVAQGLGHFVTLLVHDEAMREHGLEGCNTACAHRLQQGVVEPSAMLIRSFQVQIRRPRQAARLQHESVGAAGFKPHVHDVHHLLVVVGVPVVAEEARRGGGVPAIRTVPREGVHDAIDHGLVSQWLAGCLVNEYGDGHAPGALAADAPVRTGGDHGADAVAPGIGHELGGVDRGQGLLADTLRPIHSDKPLRRRAEDQGCAGTPGVRVGVDDFPPRDERSCLGQGGAHVVGYFVDMLPGEQRHPGVEGAVVGDGFRDVQFMGAAEVEIVLPMAGGDVDEAGSGFRCYEIGQQQGRILLVTVAA